MLVHFAPSARVANFRVPWAVRKGWDYCPVCRDSGVVPRMVTGGYCSIPHVLLIPLHPVGPEQLPQLVLEVAAAVVPLLVRDVASHGRHVRGTDRERPVAVLPVEAGVD